jgi:hypothetical protein
VSLLAVAAEVSNFLPHPLDSSLSLVIQARDLGLHLLLALMHVRERLLVLAVLRVESHLRDASVASPSIQA